MLASTALIVFGCIYVLLHWVLAAPSAPTSRSMYIACVIRYIVPIPLFIISFLALLFVASLILFHLYLGWVKQTTAEWVRGMKYTGTGSSSELHLLSVLWRCMKYNMMQLTAVLAYVCSSCASEEVQLQRILDLTADEESLSATNRNNWSKCYLSMHFHSKDSKLINMHKPLDSTDDVYQLEVMLYNVMQINDAVQNYVHHQTN